MFEARLTNNSGVNIPQPGYETICKQMRSKSARPGFIIPDAWA